VNLRFTPRAVDDLNDIADYVRVHSPSAATRVRAAILESLSKLQRFPQLGRRQDIETVRKIVTQRYPYLVYYNVDDAAQEVIILSIRHPAREREFKDL
jgi:toxin ParE1/3/4